MAAQPLKEALTDTIASIEKDPRKARTVFRASCDLEDGVRCSVKVRDFEPLIIDEPASLGGSDSGMNPVELVLAALGTCQQIVYAAYAAVMGLKLDNVSVEVKGRIDLRGLFGMGEDTPPGYEQIQFETTISSPEPEEKIQQLISLAESRCPVLDIITRPIPVTGKVLLNGATVHAQAWVQEA